MDRQFNRASLILVALDSAGQAWVFGGKGLLRALVVGTCTCADARVAARGQAGRHEPARRRTRVSSDDDGGGYQLRRWSNSKAGARWSSGSAEGSCSASTASHSGGPRAGAMLALVLKASNLR